MNKVYKISDALEILKIEEDDKAARNKLFYWINARGFTNPVEQGRRRGARTKLSIFNLIELAFATKLANLGIEYGFIERILKTQLDVCVELDEEGKYTKPGIFSRYMEMVCYYYRKHRNERNAHFFVVIYKKDDNYEFWLIGYPGRTTLEDIMKKRDYALVIVDLFEILRDLEKKTRELI